MARKRRNENKGLRSIRCPLCNGRLFYAPYATGNMDPRRFYRNGTTFLCTDCGYGAGPEKSETGALRPLLIPSSLSHLIRQAPVKFAYKSHATQKIAEARNMAGNMPWWPVGAQFCDQTGRVTHTIDPAVRKGKLVWEARKRTQRAGRPRTVTYEKFADALKATEHEAPAPKRKSSR